MVADQSPEPDERDTVPRYVGNLAAPLVVVAVIVALIVVFVRRDGGEGDKGPAAAPPRESPATTSVVPSFLVEGTLPGRGALGQGTAANGAAWTLALGEPSAGLCLTVEAGAGGNGRSVCAALPAEDSVASEENYLPVRHAGSGVPPFVFGRMPPGVTEVEVILADGGSLGRVPVVSERGGVFYAVEVTGVSQPIAVFGYLVDGTSVRFELPR